MLDITYTHSEIDSLLQYEDRASMCFRFNDLILKDEILFYIAYMVHKIRKCIEVFLIAKIGIIVFIKRV